MEKLVKKSENFSEWYSQLIQMAELADYTSVSGCIVFRPYSYAIWENIKAIFDEMIKKLGHHNCYFPLFIPESLLKKESKHVKGFTPEVAWVTHAGERKLIEKLAVRPTSETIMYESYAKWIRSWRDLPLLLNQWNSVVRWEFKYPKPFIRTREFLWQEGHTAHATKEEAEEEAMRILKLYVELIENYLAIPTFIGKKTEKEKFAGAIYTLTVESLMPDGKALQLATSHFLGQNFAKPFNIKFKDKDGKEKYVWQTSWGFSTRLIGAIIMLHGDDKGLILPPRIAPLKIVIIPIIFKKHKRDILKYCKKIKNSLKVSSVIDDRDHYTAGWKFYEWELKGVPIRIEIGPKDMKENKVTIVRRDTGKKSVIKANRINNIENVLEEIQKNLFLKAKKFLENNIVEVYNKNEFKKAIKDKKLVKAAFCCNLKCEEKIKEETGATTRCIPFKKQKLTKCVYCGKTGKAEAYFGKNY